MKWSEYYERYDDWQDSTQYSRLASITDFGPDSSPSSEIADCVQYVEEKTALRILKLALQNGVCFSGSEVADIIEYVTQDEKVTLSLFRTSDLSTYQANDIERIVCCLGDDEPALELLDDICKTPLHFKDTELVSICEELGNDEYIEKLLLANQEKFSEEALNSLCDLCVDEKIIKEIARKSNIPYSNPDEEDEFDFVAPPRQEKGLGFFGTIAAITGIASVSSHLFDKKKHTGKCDGDCANCPPHYGYRYGRWYYGHGHVHGCEFGGNRGGGPD